MKHSKATRKKISKSLKEYHQNIKMKGVRLRKCGERTWKDMDKLNGKNGGKIR